MPFRHMLLRGKKVLARCEPSGELRVEGGRVEVRYKPNDGRAYAASPRNLSPVDGPILPDDFCGEASPVASKAARGAKGAGAGKARGAGGSKASPPSAPTGDEILVYADGACSGNPGPAGLGVVMVWDGGRRELSEYLGRGTNNIAELTAILRAVEATPDPRRPLHIYTDSNYAIGVLTKGWKAKANVELVGAIRAALRELPDVVLRHVPGHAGVPLNERADQLAVAAVEARASAGWVAVKG